MRITPRLLLVALALGATAHAQSPDSTTAAAVPDSSAAPAVQCPAFAACSAQGCFDPTYVPVEVPATQYFDFHGQRVPDSMTNSPLVNAGLFFLHQTGSEQVLKEALGVVCRKVDPNAIDCESGAAAGRDHTALSTAPALTFPVWTAFLPVPQGETPPSAVVDPQQAACREYARIARGLAQTLLPAGIALQSSPLSAEGIVLRLSLSRGLKLRQALESRCQAPGAAAKPSPGQCGALGQFFDDLRFAFLLTDKLSADNKSANALKLLRQAKLVVEHLESVAGAATTEGVNLLLGVDWENLRAAIQLALSN